MERLDLLATKTGSRDENQSAREKHPDNSSPAGGFNHLMEQALKSGGKTDPADGQVWHGQKIPNTKVRAAKNQPDTAVFKTELPSADAANPAREKITDEKNLSGAAKAEAPDDGPKSSAQPLPDAAGLMNISDSPTVFLALPLAGNFLAGDPAGETAAAQTNQIPAVLTVAPVTGGLVSALNQNGADGRKAAGAIAPAAKTTDTQPQPKTSPPELTNVKLTPEISALMDKAVSSAAENNAAASLKTSVPTAILDPTFGISKSETEPISAVGEKNKPLVSIESTPAQNAGTGVALDVSLMKKTANVNEVAGLDVQVLPGGTNGTARETISTVHTASGQVRSQEKPNSDFNQPLPGLNMPVTEHTETAAVIALPSLADARMRDVERTHDLVSLHALRLVESKADSLQVVIKPGAGTELSLELRHRNGNVEVEAVLQRGDFQLMNQHWPELQEKLEQRGIKLSMLGGGANFSPANNGDFSRRQQPSSEENAQQASAFAEFTLAMNRGGATARLATVPADGWESWA